MKDKIPRNDPAVSRAARFWNGWHTALFIVSAAVVASYAYARLPANPTGVCRPALGEGTTLADVSSSASAQLVPDAEYAISCTVATYCELASGSAPTADSNSFPYDIGLRYFGTVKNENPYIACVDQAAASGSCELILCR